jgi:hypothetical protein
MVRDFGWKITVKYVRRYTDEAGNVSMKANADLDMAVDAMLQAEKLDQVILVTGDGDFLQVVDALQNRGCRVELIGFKNVSRALQQEVDAFWSGFLIPDLLPVSYEPRNEWGKPGSCVRGVCTKWFPDKGYGFLRFISHISPDLWITDPREPLALRQRLLPRQRDRRGGERGDADESRDHLEFYLPRASKRTTDWLPTT